jgi:hypothetical protein
MLLLHLLLKVLYLRGLLLQMSLWLLLLNELCWWGLLLLMLLYLFCDGNSEMQRNATMSVGDLLDGSVDGDFDGEIFQLFTE